MAETESKTKIKICGITSIDDALACHGLGADVLGLIFAQSPRRVTIETARRIRGAVPDARLAGVFADAGEEILLDAVEAAALDAIQLHGHESPRFCEEVMERTGKPVIRALRSSMLSKPHMLSAFDGLPILLFDLEPDERDPAPLWRLAAWAGEQGFRFYLAGALDASNVAAALRAASPFGVDVCRGVERAPGEKDLEKVKAFIEEVRRCPSTN